MANQKTLTTGQAAKVCRVSQRTVIRWIDSGRLKGHRFPGSGGHRRILVEDLHAFLEQNGLPVPHEFQQRRSRVLILEDEAVVAFLIEDVLLRAGYDVRIAANGFAAGLLLETFHPDVITLDLNMPGVPGIDVLTALRKKDKYRHIGILVVSGMPRNELDEAVAKGANNALAKPFRNEDLVEYIGHLAPASMANNMFSLGG